MQLLFCNVKPLSRLTAQNKATARGKLLFKIEEINEILSSRILADFDMTFYTIFTVFSLIYAIIAALTI